MDVVWLWQGPKTFPSLLPLVGFEVESSWRTRKHLKGDLLNLLDLQPSLGVIILLGDGPDVEGTRRFAQQTVARRTARIEIWSEQDVMVLAKGRESEAARVLSEYLPTKGDDGKVGQRVHSGKYQALSGWLAGQDLDTVRVSFAEIEEILGFPLPPSSRRHPAHWHSYDGSAVVRAIRDAGWRVSRLDLTQKVVTFERLLPPNRGNLQS